ncbi:MAG: pilin [Patescibacteria group bacterium]
MKKISLFKIQISILFLIIILIPLFFLFVQQAQAEGLVPCGRTNDPNATSKEKQPCQFCHIFILFQNILKFLFFEIVPVLAILMIAVAGMYFIFAGGQPGNIGKAKEILTNTAIALLIIYGAWLLINLFFMVIGVNEVDFTNFKNGWFQIDCQIK